MFRITLLLEIFLQLCFGLQDFVKMSGSFLPLQELIKQTLK